VKKFTSINILMIALLLLSGCTVVDSIKSRKGIKAMSGNIQAEDQQWFIGTDTYILSSNSNALSQRFDMQLSKACSLHNSSELFDRLASAGFMTRKQCVKKAVRKGLREKYWPEDDLQEFAYLAPVDGKILSLPTPTKFISLDYSYKDVSYILPTGSVNLTIRSGERVEQSTPPYISGPDGMVGIIVSELTLRTLAATRAVAEKSGRMDEWLRLTSK
jgi:hypothetical protein